MDCKNLPPCIQDGQECMCFTDTDSKVINFVDVLTARVRSGHAVLIAVTAGWGALGSAGGSEPDAQTPRGPLARSPGGV